MKTMHLSARKEKGQIIVLLAIITLMVIALIGMLFDGGRLMINRRQAQAAADAGALAGAQILCNNTSLVGAYQAELDAQDAARSYVEERNYADLIGFDISYDIYHLGAVSVTASVSSPSILASIIGVSTITSNADAAAACLVPKNGLLPVAWYCEGLIENDCGVTMSDWPDPKVLPAPILYYLLVDPNSVPSDPWSWCEDFSDPLGTVDGEMICHNTPGLFPSDVPFQALGNGGRAWIKTLCPSAAIGDFILNAWGVMVTGTVIETPGVKESVYKPGVWPNLPSVYLLPFYNNIISYPEGQSGGSFDLAGESAFVVTCVQTTQIKNIPLAQIDSRIACAAARAWYRENLTKWLQIPGNTQNTFEGLMGYIEGYFVNPLFVDVNDPGWIDALSLGVYYVSLVK